MSKILAETSEAIFQTLKDRFLRTPNCQKEWLNISKGLEDKWIFPNCLGFFDDPHRVSKIVRNILLQLQGFLQHLSSSYLR